LNATTRMDREEVIMEKNGTKKSFLTSTLLLAVNIIRKSRDASAVRESLHSILLVQKNCSTSDSPLLRSAMEEVAEQVIQTVFQRITSELMAMNVNTVGEVLHRFAKEYPSQTREAIKRLPEGNSEMAEQMFANVNLKNFRLRVTQMHQAAMKRA